MSLLGERLCIARERKNLKQVGVYKKTNINNKTLSRYEKGGTEPDIETLNILADLYEVSIDWLTGRVNYPKIYFTEDERKVIGFVDLADEESIMNAPLKYKGRELTRAEKRRFMLVFQALSDSEKV